MAASAADAPATRGERYRGLLLRLISAAILGPLLLGAIWFGFPWIDLVAALAAPLMVSEWLRLTRGRPAMRVLAILYALAAVVSLQVHAMEYGPQAALIAESFPTHLRYGGAGLGYQLASVFAGGPAPLIATWLLHETGSLPDGRTVSCRGRARELASQPIPAAARICVAGMPGVGDPGDRGAATEEHLSECEPSGCGHRPCRGRRYPNEVRHPQGAA